MAAVQSSRQCLLSSGAAVQQAVALQQVGDAAIKDSEDGFFASLALQHSKELDCSSDFAQQLSGAAGAGARENVATKMKVLREAAQRLTKAVAKLMSPDFTGGKVCPLAIDDLQPPPKSNDPGNDFMWKSQQDYYDTCKEIITTRSAYEAIFHSIPLSGTPEVKKLLEDYAYSKSAADGADPAKSIETLDKNLDANIAKAYGQSSQSLRSSAKDLLQQGKGSGADIDRGTRYALLSDPAVTEKVIESAGTDNKEIMTGIACRADQRYHSGADALDRTVMVGSLVISGGAGLVLRGGAIAARVGLAANEIRMAGLLSVNAMRTLEYSAMGLSAGLDSMAAYSQIDKSCGSKTPTTLAHGTDSSRQCVAAPTVDQLGQDSCVLAVSLSALGFTTALAPTLLKGERVAATEMRAVANGTKSLDPAVGATLNSEQRLSTASEILGRPLSSEQQKAVMAAHDVGAGQIGKDGSLASVGNYTTPQLREKAATLKAAGFNDKEIRQLMESGIVGNPRLPASLDPSLVSDPRQKTFREALFRGQLDSLPDQQKILSVPIGDGRYAYKIVKSNPDGSILVEDVDGRQMLLRTDQMSGVRIASEGTATDFYQMQKSALQKRIAQTPATSDRVNEFRQSWSSGDLARRNGASSVISYAPEGGVQNVAAQVSRVYPDGRVEVRMYDGTTKILTPAELASAKFSSTETAQSYLQAAGTLRADKVATDARVANLFQQQRGMQLEPGMTPQSGRKYVAADGSTVNFRVVSSDEFRQVAVTQGKIHEFSQGEAAKLPPGSYAYLITRDGKLVTGEVSDNFELGVKHANLADSREVVSAGELKVLSDGTYQYNLESGTFTKNMVSSMGVSQADMASRTDKALNAYFKSPGQYKNEILLPQTNPSLDTIRRACSSQPFLYVNLAACCKTVGLGCN